MNLDRSKRKSICNIIILILPLLCFSPLVSAEPTNSWLWNTAPPAPHKPPKWALEIKYGNFKHDLEDFQTFYGTSDSNHMAIAFGYKPLRTIEVGLEYGHMSTHGTGISPLDGTDSDDIKLTINPAHLYVLVRGVWGEDQIGVPYIGGGITQVSVKQKVSGQADRSFTASGNHWRYGLQFLLDRADRSAASDMKTDHGVNHTYLFIEKQHYEAETQGIELGGDTLFIGLLFEF